MHPIRKKDASFESDAAHKRLLSIRGDPFLFADWERILFLHFAITPELLSPFVHPPLELDLREGQAQVSLVAVTMRKFRPARPLSFAWALVPIPCQTFLNFRTYVRHRDEPGALFLWGWLSKPAPLIFPTFDLPCTFAKIAYRHDLESGQLSGNVDAASGRFEYCATISHKVTFGPCAPDSLAEFAMERYTGFFCRGGQTKIFRAWHPRWLQTGADIRIKDTSLVTNKFSWFKRAQFVGAHFAPGFKQVSLGHVRPLARAWNSGGRNHSPSTFFRSP